MTETAESLKEKGNAAFTKKDFELALKLYSQALTVLPSNHLLWANRSAAKAELKDYDGAVEDAQQAMGLCPKWPKGFVRKAIALTGKGDTFQAIEAYEAALKIEPNETVASRVKDLERKFYRFRYRNRPVRSLEVETDVTTCHPDVALAIAAARGIEFPTSPPIPVVRDAIVNHKKRNPRWDTPPRRFLFLPCTGDRQSGSNTLPTAPRNFEFDTTKADMQAQLNKLLGCQYTDDEVLYSEDGAEMLRGNRNGVGIGYVYRTYAFIMDDNCVNNRPLNELASRLLHRPETYGPILVLRSTHLKVTHDLYQPTDAANNVVAWEVLPLEELESEEWRVKRAEWKKLLHMSRDEGVNEVMGRSSASSQLDMMLRQLQGLQGDIHV